MKFNFFNHQELPKGMRRVLIPSRRHQERAKDRFLATFFARYPAASRAFDWTMLMRSTVGAVAVFAIMFGGASVYADTRNVAADSPLYTLKRIGESVRLALAQPAVKPRVEATLAARRAAEISDLEERDPSNVLLPSLASDLDGNLSASLGVEKRGNGPKEEESPAAATSDVPLLNAAAPLIKANEDGGHIIRTVPRAAGESEDDHELCANVKAALDTSSSIVQGEISKSSGIRERFKERCDGDSDSDDGIRIPKISKDIPLGNTPSTSSLPLRLRGDDRDQEEEGL